MSDNDKSFDSVIDSLIDGMHGLISSKTVVGEPVTVGDTIIVPLVEVSFGAGGGAASGTKSGVGNAGGMHGKMSPSAVLVIRNGITRLVSVKDQNTVAKLLDMAPDVIDRFFGPKGPDMPDDTAVDMVFPDKDNDSSDSE
ncbi:MAG: GerW family sporulation protein [Lachnospiraceae bacterium]|nr:GerW family sporulation protein [Lachnospiraceae bacterium]